MQLRQTKTISTNYKKKLDVKNKIYFYYSTNYYKKKNNIIKTSESSRTAHTKILNPLHSEPLSL